MGLITQTKGHGSYPIVQHSGGPKPQGCSQFSSDFETSQGYMRPQVSERRPELSQCSLCSPLKQSQQREELGTDRRGRMLTCSAFTGVPTHSDALTGLTGGYRLCPIGGMSSLESSRECQKTFDCWLCVGVLSGQR